MSEHEVVEDFARNLRMVRGYRGMTRREVARKAGIAPDTLGTYERGGSNPRMRTIAAVAYALDTDVRFLLARMRIPRAGTPTDSEDER